MEECKKRKKPENIFLISVALLTVLYYVILRFNFQFAGEYLPVEGELRDKLFGFAPFRYNGGHFILEYFIPLLVLLTCAFFAMGFKEVAAVSTLGVLGIWIHNVLFIFAGENYILQTMFEKQTVKVETWPWETGNWLHLIPEASDIIIKLWGIVLLIALCLFPYIYKKFVKNQKARIGIFSIYYLTANLGGWILAFTNFWRHTIFIIFRSIVLLVIVILAIYVLNKKTDEIKGESL